MSFNDPSMRVVWDEQARKQIKLHEGFRNDVYLDSVGIPTGGYGHAFLRGSSLPRYVWDLIFDKDFEIARDETHNLISQRNWHNLGWVRRNVLLDMIFNMGLHGVIKFTKMLKAIDNEDYEMVAVEMMDSKWATQVGQRAQTLARQMRTGSV